MKKKAEERPNIIFIMPDQLRHDFLSCYGASFIHTPNIDSLGSRGILFQNAYSEHPVCVAARASLLTGMNAIKTGVLDNTQFIRPDYRTCGLHTWPELLSEAGYYTVGMGKMHFYPWEKDFGFQHRIIAEDKLWGFIEDDYFHILHKAGYSKRDFIKVPEYIKTIWHVSVPTLGNITSIILWGEIRQNGFQSTMGKRRLL